MSYKSMTRMSIFIVLAMLATLIPLQVHAGGVCGGTWVAEAGDTVEKIAAVCGTSSATIFAANPGISNNLAIGQVLNVPGINYGITVTSTATSIPLPVTPTPPVTVINNYYTYNYYNSYNYYPAGTYSGTYIVQAGDTFAGIAYRYGLTIYDLMAANPYVTDINLLYVGQSLYIPANYWEAGPAPISVSKPATVLSTGDIPKGAPSGTVRLQKKADEDVYVSLRTSRKDGTSAINEFSVRGTMDVSIPAGWVDYVAYVGGIKFTGGFQLGEERQVTLTFNRSKVVVD